MATMLEIKRAEMAKKLRKIADIADEVADIHNQEHKLPAKDIEIVNRMGRNASRIAWNLENA